MMEERVYGTKGQIQADIGTDDISISSPAAPDTGCEISIGEIFIRPGGFIKGAKNIVKK